MGPRILCPGEIALPEFHFELEKVLNQIGEIKNEIQKFRSLPMSSTQEIRAFVGRYVRNLQIGYKALTAVLQDLRDQFATINDIEGLSPEYRVEEFYPSSRSGRFLDEHILSRGYW